MVDVAAKSPEHGTRARYRAGCRCSDCQRWKADDTAAYRERKRKRDAGDDTPPEPKRAASRARPTAPKRPTPQPSDAEVDRRFDGIVEQFEAGPIEAAARDAFALSDDPATRLRQEVLFRGARSLDDPKNARYYSSTVEAMRKVLADLTGDEGSAGGGGIAGIVEAIREAGRDRDDPEVVDPA